MLSTAGDQVPVNPSIEEEGSVNASPAQMGAIAANVDGAGALTIIVPIASCVPHPPVNGIVKLNVPEALGVPLTVIVLPAKLAVTPAGKPVAAPMPVAPVVEKVTLGIAVLIHTIGFDDADVTVLFGISTISAVPLVVPLHPASETDVNAYNPSVASVITNVGDA